VEVTADVHRARLGSLPSRHSGAKLSLFDTSEGFRHTRVITNENALSFDAAAPECRHRGHARVEDRVRCWKDCGLQNLPFASFTQNLAWVATSLLAGRLSPGRR